MVLLTRLVGVTRITPDEEFELGVVVVTRVISAGISGLVPICSGLKSCDRIAMMHAYA